MLSRRARVLGDATWCSHRPPRPAGTAGRDVCWWIDGGMVTMRPSRDLPATFPRSVYGGPMAPEHVHVQLLGAFCVEVDGAAVGPERWERPQARTLVKLLALAPGHRLHREQVVDVLWPGASLEEAAPRLHKLAHYARRALGGADAVVLDDAQVRLAPDADLVVDVDEFEDLANRAVERRDGTLATKAADLHRAGLLPEDRYAPWCEPRRQHLRRLYLDVLRVAERWEDLLAVEPADEQAHLRLMRRFEDEGRRVLALRQYERMEEALLRTVGLGPGDEARQLRERLLTASRPPEGGLIGREAEQARFERIAARTEAGEGRAVLVAGRTGLGKTALARWGENELRRLGWAVASGAGGEIQAPGTPLLEALRLLADRHPDALAKLSEDARTDLARAWSRQPLARPGESATHRVALAAEHLLVAITRTTPVAIVIHRLDQADHATLHLFHSLARVARRERILLVGTMLPVRSGSGPAGLRSSLLDLDAAEEIVLDELDDRSAATVFERELGRAAPRGVSDRVVQAVGGNPLLLTEAARGAPTDDPEQMIAEAVATSLDRLPVGHADALQRAALLGERLPVRLLEVVTTDGHDPTEVVESWVATGLVELRAEGYRFRHPAIRAAVAASVPVHRRRWLHADLAERLEAAGAPPDRIAHHLVEAGDPGAAAPHQLAAATRAWEAGTYADALERVEGALPSASGPVEAELRCLRARLLDALGDPSVLAAYADAIEAVPDDRRPLLRAQRARTALTMGDVEAAEGSLDGLTPDGSDADGMILLARGMLAFFRGDLDRAEVHAREARHHALRDDAPSRLLDAITLDGLVAHTRGRWQDRIRQELEEAVRSPLTAAVVFDSHLCVAEYLLYGSRDYDEVAGFARSFRAVSEERGVGRAEAFAAALEGEARLLAGDLDHAADLLAEAADAHRTLRASTGEAHCTQRLAEVRIARGDTGDARRLLDHALGLARWSPLARHLLPRIYGTMIRAARDREEASAVVDHATNAMGPSDECMFCPVMFEVPATVALADAGRLDAAEHHLALAREYAARWHPSSWDAAVAEARGHVHLARDEHAEAERLLVEAAEGFAHAGHRTDEQRCREARVMVGRL